MGKGYDYLIVGAGLFGAAFAQIMTERGKRCAVIEKRESVPPSVAAASASDASAKPLDTATLRLT